MTYFYIIYSINFRVSKNNAIFATEMGGLAQLVRALAWHARGREFESHILHRMQCEYDWPLNQSYFFIAIYAIVQAQA